MWGRETLAGPRASNKGLGGRLHWGQDVKQSPAAWCPEHRPQLRESKKETQNIVKHRDSACDFRAPGAWPDYKGLGLEAAAQPVLPSEWGCRQHGLPGCCSPGDASVHGLAVLGHPKALGDLSPALGPVGIHSQENHIIKQDELRAHGSGAGGEELLSGAVWGVLNSGGPWPHGATGRVA